MKREYSEILEAIRTAADELRRVVEPIPAELLVKRPEPEEWSVLETLVHVRNVVLFAYGLRIRLLLFQENPSFPNYHDEAEALETASQQVPAADLVEMIVRDHEQTVQLLRHLPDDAWLRQGQHEMLGAMSLAFLARRVAEHAQEHRQQIVDTVAALS